MIDRMTPLGTKIVCVNDKLFPNDKGNGNLDGLKKGETYTVRRIYWSDFYDEYSVELQEIPRLNACGYDLSRFVTEEEYNKPKNITLETPRGTKVCLIDGRVKYTIRKVFNHVTFGLVMVFEEIVTPDSDSDRLFFASKYKIVE